MRRAENGLFLLCHGLVRMLVGGDKGSLVEVASAGSGKEGGEEVHPDVGPDAKDDGRGEGAGGVEGGTGVGSNGKDGGGDGETNGKGAGRSRVRGVDDAKDSEDEGKGADELPEEDGHRVVGREVAEGGEGVGVTKQFSGESKPEEDSADEGSDHLGDDVAKVGADIELVLEGLRSEEAGGDGRVQVSTRDLGGGVDGDGEGQTVAKGSRDEAAEGVGALDGRVGSSGSSGTGRAECQGTLRTRS